MDMRSRSTNGYSMIELLVVLVIVGVLSMVGVGMVGNRNEGSVRSVLNELEGALVEAQIAAGATGRDVSIVTWGSWNPTLPMSIAKGSSALSSLDIQTIATKMLAKAPVMPTTALEKTVNVPFLFRQNARDCMYAGVVTSDSSWWLDAMGAGRGGMGNQDIKTVSPFSNADKSFLLAIGSANNLFSGALNTVSVSGSNRRFNNTFCIQVVGLTNGRALPGGPMGLIVVQAGGASVYKFYNSGVNKGDGQWRRI